MTPCEAGFHPTLESIQCDGMGAWKCTECDYEMWMTDIKNNTCDTICDILMAAAAEPKRKGTFGSSKLRKVEVIMRKGLAAK